VTDQGGPGFVKDVCRQCDEAPTDDSQGRALNLFSAGFVEILVQSPQQRRPDVTSIRLSRPKPIRETDPATIPAMMETRPSALL